MTPAERQRAKRAAARAEGKCPNCIRRKLARGRRRCRVCLKYANSWQTKHHDGRVSQQLCARCGAPATHGPKGSQRFCDGCRTLATEAGKDWRQDQRAAGWCLSCRRKATKTGYCRRHTSMRRARETARRRVVKDGTA